MADQTPVAVLVAAIRYAESRTAQDRQADIARYVARSAPSYDIAERAWLIREVGHLLMVHPGPVAGEVWEPVLDALRGPDPKSGPRRCLGCGEEPAVAMAEHLRRCRATRAEDPYEPDARPVRDTPTPTNSEEPTR